MKLGKISLLASVIAIASVVPAWGQATRTWVSGVGDDANPCSRTAPCKTFAGAISKTAAGGEINTLDPGGFGGVTITKSITISQDGTGEAGVLVSGTNAIIINAGVNDVIVLRGLDIEGLGTGLSGIRMLAGKQLHVENCTIHNFKAASAGFGIDINTTTAGVEVFIKDTTIRNNGTGSTGGGIILRPVATAVRANLENVRLENNVFGVKGLENTTTTVSNSLAAGNTNGGFSATASTALALIIVVDSVASGNNGVNGTGAEAIGATASVRIGGSTVTGNTTGLFKSGGGQILSFGDNNVSGNTTEFTAPAPTLIPKI